MYIQNLLLNHLVLKLLMFILLNWVQAMNEC